MSASRRASRDNTVEHLPMRKSRSKRVRPVSMMNRYVSEVRSEDNTFVICDVGF